MASEPTIEILGLEISHGALLSTIITLFTFVTGFLISEYFKIISRNKVSLRLKALLEAYVLAMIKNCEDQKKYLTKFRSIAFQSSRIRKNLTIQSIVEFDLSMRIEDLYNLIYKRLKMRREEKLLLHSKLESSLTALSGIWDRIRSTHESIISEHPFKSEQFNRAQLHYRLEFNNLMSQHGLGEIELDKKLEGLHSFVEKLDPGKGHYEDSMKFYSQVESYCKENFVKEFNLLLEILQRLNFEYENLKHFHLTMEQKLENREIELSNMVKKLKQVHSSLIVSKIKNVFLP